MAEIFDSFFGLLSVCTGRVPVAASDPPQGLSFTGSLIEILSRIGLFRSEVVWEPALRRRIFETDSRSAIDVLECERKSTRREA